MKNLKLTVLPDVYAICRFDPGEKLPEFDTRQSLLSITWTEDEISLVIRQEDVQPGWQTEPDWVCLKVLGPLDFSLVGIMASIASPLGQAGISLFAVSTFDTDYILIKEANLKDAQTVLSAHGFTFIENG